MIESPQTVPEDDDAGGDWRPGPGLLLLATTTAGAFYAGSGSPGPPVGRVIFPRAPGRRGKFTRAIRRLFKVRPGQARRHILSDRYVRRIAAGLSAKDLKDLGYNVRKLGGLKRARRRFQQDLFNDPRNIWVGGKRKNEEFGRRWREGWPNWDFPPKGYKRPRGWQKLIPKRRRGAHFDRLFN